MSLKFRPEDPEVPDCVTCTVTGLALPAVTVTDAVRCDVLVFEPVGVMRSVLPCCESESHEAVVDEAQLDAFVVTVAVLVAVSVAPKVIDVGDTESVLLAVVRPLWVTVMFTGVAFPALTATVADRCEELEFAVAVMRSLFPS